MLFSIGFRQVERAIYISFKFPGTMVTYSLFCENTSHIIADRVMRTCKKSGVRWILKVCKSVCACAQ